MEKQRETIKLNGIKVEDLIGVFDENVNLLNKELGVLFYLDDGSAVIEGEPEKVEFAKKLVQKLIDVLKTGELLDKTRILYLIDALKNGNVNGIEKTFAGVIAVTSKGKQIKPKTIGQKKYVSAIGENVVTFGIGPAGTGKTYLAVVWRR